MMDLGVVKYWFAVAIAFALIVSLSWCAKAQEAQVGPKWEPVRIEVTMHRHHAQYVSKHHKHRHNSKSKTQGAKKPTGVEEAHRGMHPRSIERSNVLPPITSPLYIEFVTWCVARALPCILPYHERN